MESLKFMPMFCVVFFTFTVTSVHLTWYADDICTVYADGVQKGHTDIYDMKGHVEIPGKMC